MWFGRRSSLQSTVVVQWRVPRDANSPMARMHVDCALTPSEIKSVHEQVQLFLDKRLDCSTTRDFFTPVMLVVEEGAPVDSDLLERVAREGRFLGVFLQVENTCEESR